MVTARLLYPLLKVVIGAALCTRVAMASMVPTPLLKPREYGLIGWADHLTLATLFTLQSTKPSLSLCNTTIVPGLVIAFSYNT